MTTVRGWTDSLPYVLFRANQSIHRRVVDAVSGLGVTITQLGLVVHLDELGHLSGSDLARRFRLTPQSISTALGHLERLGWVRRVPHPVHRRVIWYEVTEAGHEGALDGRRRVGAVQAELEQLLGGTLMDDAIRDLAAIIEAVDGPDPTTPSLWPVEAG